MVEEYLALVLLALAVVALILKMAQEAKVMCLRLLEVAMVAPLVLEGVMVEPLMLEGVTVEHLGLEVQEELGQLLVVMDRVLDRWVLDRVLDQVLGHFHFHFQVVAVELRQVTAMGHQMEPLQEHQAEADSPQASSHWRLCCKGTSFQ